MDTTITNQHGEKLDYTFHRGTEDTDRLVIIGHGITANKDRPFIVALANGLAEKGYHVIRFSYAGNGNSDGKFEEATISKEVDDLGSVIDQVGPFQIAFVGHSMSGAVGVLRTARDDRIKALVSLAGMVYTAEFVERKFGDLTPGKDVMWDKPDCPLSQEFLDDARKIDHVKEQAKEISVPWLLVHGTADTVVLPKDSEDVLEATGGKTDHVTIDGGDHLFNHDATAPMVEATTNWLAKNFPLS